MARAPSSSLLDLINQLQQAASLPERNLWLHDLLQWVRGDRRNATDAAARLGLLVDALLARPEHTAAFARWWQLCRDDMDATPLLSDLGFAPRTSFASELGQRLRLKTLPATGVTGRLFSPAAVAATSCGAACSWFNASSL